MNLPDEIASTRQPSRRTRTPGTTNQRRKALTRKRGGGRAIISWDHAFAEERFRQEPADELSPDKIYDRRWALTVLEQAAQQLRADYDSADQTQPFEKLRAYVSSERSAPSYAESAAELGLTENAVKSAIFRIRRRYRELVR